jgi:exonuclease SbcC
MRQAQYDDIAKLMESVDQGLITQCPTCYSDLSGSAEGIAHIKHEQKNNNKQILSLRFQIDDLSEEISAIAEDIRDKRTRKESYDGLMAKINTITALISSYDKNRVEAMRSETDLLAKVKDIDTRNYAHPNLFETEQELQQVKGKRQRLSAIVEKINNLRHLREDNERIKTTLDKNAEEQAIGAASLREINFSEDRYDKLNAEVNEIAETLAETREQLIQHRADRQIMENNLKNKNQEHDRADKIRTEVEGYRETIHVFSLVDEIMTQLRLDLANRITPKLGEYTSNYLRDITDGLYQNIVLDENYNIKVLVDNEEWPLAQMSGGEQDVINLCMRLAISQIILESKNVPYNMIILDEIFGSQDDERKLAIIDVIGRLKAIFPQIILITHINEVKDRADTIIDIAKDAKGNSYVLR